VHSSFALGNLRIADLKSYKNLIIIRVYKAVLSGWCSSLRHCGTSQQVAGSIPDGVTGIFRWHNPSGGTMALGSTQLLTEVSTRNIYWWLKAAVPRADFPTTFVCRLYRNLRASASWNPQGLPRPVMGLLYVTPKTGLKWHMKKNLWDTRFERYHCTNLLGGGLVLTHYWIFGFRKRRGISWLDEWPLDPWESLQLAVHRKNVKERGR
jgi:hypothetical protein